MIKKIMDLYDNYQEMVNYIFFGGLTTLVNIVVFFLLDTGLGWPYLIANAVAIVVSILFAYVTNKIWVFQSKTENFQETFYEFTKFIGFRLLSGLADMAAMWVLVDLLIIDSSISKLLTQFIVVVLNYVFSKFFIFL